MSNVIDLKTIKTEQPLLRFQMSAQAFQDMMAMPKSSKIVGVRLNGEMIEFLIQDDKVPAIINAGVVDTRPTMDEDGTWNWNIKA